VSELIPATFRTPFGLGPEWVRGVRPGMSLMEMALAMDLPAEWWQAGRGVVDIDGRIVPREMWPHVRPKPGAGITEIRFLFALHGGGGGEGDKNPLALIASLALLAATGFVAGGGLAPLFGAGFAQGTLGANLAAGAIGLLGNALIGGLARPQRGRAEEVTFADAPNNAGIEGNVLSPEGPVPRVMGTRKVYPPFASEALLYFDGDDEVAEAVYVLAGPHEITDLRLAGAPVDDMRGVEVETREGWPGDSRVELVTRQAKTENVNQELRAQALGSDGLTVDDQVVGGWEPQPYVIATREAPDEVWLPITFPQGLNINAETTTNLRVPFRIRMRQIGDSTWINLPELHYVGAAIKPIRATIKLVWDDSPDPQVAAAAGTGWETAYITVPDQTDIPAGGGWAADSSFDDGVGPDDYLWASNYEDTAVKNVQMTRDEARIFLDTATFPKGAWEIEITRGLAVTESAFDRADYEVSGSVWALFGGRGVGTLQVAQSQKDKAATVGVVRVSNVWNEHPTPTDRFSVIAIRVRNRQVGQLSCIASGYVRNIATDAWITSSNPADHFRDVLRSPLMNPDPVPESVIDDTDLLAWRTDCTSKGYEINGIVEGGTVREILARVAGAGFAMPRMSNEWGVVRGTDTSSDTPVQVFTPRNAREISVAKAFPDPPDGIRATFRDKTQEYRDRQIIWPPTATGGDLLAFDYPDDVTEAEVLQQVQFDLAELSLRSASVSFTAGAETLACRRGDLVELQHDMLDRHAGAGRVVDWTENGSGEVTAITLDADVPVTNEPDVRAVTDLRAVPDFRALGLSTSIALRGDDGTPVRSVLSVSTATGTTRTLTLETAAADTGIHEGALVAVGPSSRVTERLIVADIRRSGLFDAQVTCVDEAPELFAGH
jgi:hypothetical protein